ncbi:MAG: Uma2 family endonuclease [Deltaproteobacteria bacterium]|nr:Uma2 family endonuclease [Deltaproteobacteria bacterium]
MPLAEQPGALTPEAYLEWEKLQEGRHEYVDGQVFAMSGASLIHATVSLNIASLLRNHLRGGPCRAFTADIKARVAAEGPFFYPDVVVTCDERDRANAYYVAHPTLIVEVLSPTTAAYDRGQKFASYRRIETLREYVLVDTELRSVECFRKDASGHWVLYPFGPDGEVELESLGLRCLIDAVYEDTEVPARAEWIPSKGRTGGT